MKDISKYIVTIATLILLMLLIYGLRGSISTNDDLKKITVGFIYDGDAATPYTANFARAENALVSEYGDKVTIKSINNVPTENSEESIESLAKEGCDIIFTNSFGFGVVAKKIAEKYPNIQFCQATCSNANEAPVLDNYHTFMGEIYEGRFISGVVGGMKLKELVDSGKITEEEAVVGYVGAYPYAEVISGYTAFFLGVRSVMSNAVMKVKYANSWTDYNTEKKLAAELIEEGCVLISQHSDTIGPAVACEEAHSKGKTVYHVGYNQSMIGVAPTTSLVSCRINWNPYIVGAVGAVMRGRNIEESVKGHVHGNDIGAGFENDWVQLLEVNDAITGTEVSVKADELIERFKTGSIDVFKGNFIGVNPDDPADTIDLSGGYRENATTSAPQFNYVLKDCIIIE